MKKRTNTFRKNRDGTATMTITRKDGEKHYILLDGEDADRVQEKGSWKILTSGNSDTSVSVAIGYKDKTATMLSHFLVDCPEGRAICRKNRYTLDFRKANLFVR